MPYRTAVPGWRAPVLFLVLILHLPATHAADAAPPAEPDPGRASYALREEVTGSHLPSAWASMIPVPPDKSYAQLSDAQKAWVRSQYEAMPDEDIPPYPAHGKGTLLRLVRQAAEAYVGDGPGIHGLARFVVTIDSSGRPTGVSVLESPELGLTRTIAMILATSEFTPAVCHGAPCRMDYPFAILFK